MARSDKGKKHAPYDNRLRSHRAQLRRLAQGDPVAEKPPKRLELRRKARMSVIPADRVCPCCRHTVAHSRRAWVCFWVTGAARGFAVCKACWWAFKEFSNLTELRNEFESNDEFDINFVACELWRETLEPSNLCKRCLACTLRKCRKL